MPIENDSDSYDEDYLLQKQLSHEFHSPEFQGFNDRTREVQKEQETEFKKDLINQGVPQGEASTSTAGLEEPTVDPVSAAVGGFVGPLKTAVSQGAKLLPSLGRATTSATVSAISEYPIGVATEKVSETYPQLALPMTVVLGMVSGVTIEKAIENSVVKGFEKAGQKATKAMIKQEAASVGEKIKAGVFDETTADAVTAINKQIGEVPVEKALGSGVPKPNSAETYEQIAIRSKEGTIKIVDYKKGGHTDAIDQLPLKEQFGKNGEALPIEDGMITSTGRFVPRPKDIDGNDIDGADLIGSRVSGSTESKFLEFESDIADKKYTSNINLHRIESAEDIKRQLDKTAQLFAPEVETARRSYRTNAQTAKTANLLGMTTEQLLKRRKGVAFNAEEALAARRILVSSADNLTQMAQKVQSLDATDIDKFAFRKAMNTHYAIQMQVSGMTAEAGRALQSFNISAGSSKVKVAQIKEFLENVPGGTVDDLSKAILSMDSLNGLSVFTKQVQRATTVDMFLEAWINGLLSGPQTHAVNTLSNSLVAIWQIPERVLASGVSKVLGDNAIGSGEALSQAFGLVQGAKDGFKLFAKSAWQTARLKPVEVMDPLSKIEARKHTAITAKNIQELPIINKIAPNSLEEGGVAARFADYLGEAIRTPGKLLVAEDDFFKSVGYRMELNSRAYRRATLEEGLKGTAAASRMQEIIGNPQEMAPDIHLAAIDASRYQTFTKPLGEGGKAVQTFLNNHPMGRVIVPFVRTPTNIMKFAGERTPLAFISKNVRNEIQMGGARRDLALAKISMGSMAMGTVAALTMSGNITGNGPTDPGMRQLKYDLGWKPYSVKVGDKYYSYNRLEPVGMLFGIAADFTEIAGAMTEDERDSLATAIVSAVSQNITSKTWLRGLSEAISAVEDPQRYGAQWWENLAGTVVPTGVAQVERVLSPEMSAIHSVMDSIKSRIPGYSDTLPPRRNLWAEVIAPEGGLGPDIISPIYTSTVKDSPITKELLDSRIPLRMPKQTQIFDGVPIPLEPKEYDRLLVLMNETHLNSTGQVLKDSLNNLVTKDIRYQNTEDPELKEMMIRSLVTEARFLAKEQLKYEFPIIGHIIADDILKKQQLQR